MTRDRDWTDAEREALRSLGEPVPPPPELEDRIAAAAAERGLVDPTPAGSRRIGSWWNGVIAAAAAIVLLVAGAWLGARLDAPEAPGGPRFLLLLYEGPGFDASGDVASEYATWALRMRDLGRAVEGEELAPEARLEGRIPDGAPSGASASGRPTGYFVIEARDLEQAEAIAASHPHVARGGGIEVRPIVER